MDLSQQPAYSAPKPSHGRNKPTARQRGQISTKVRKELRERSGGVCERCMNEKASQAAHCIRRWRIEVRTTVHDLAHLCYDCHYYCDNNKSGREWLEAFRNKQLEESA
jgi:hypothetical protein